MKPTLPASYHPMALFREWFIEIEGLRIREPMAAAVCLATATKGGVPSSRMVLLKHYDEEGFVIYTNMQSRKGVEISQNPRAALCFYWQELGKQVCVEGNVITVPDEEADAYFNSRPFNSKIGAWASKQSRPMRHPYDLVKRIAKYTALWAIKQVKRPPYWVGLRIVPDYYEFVEPGDSVYDSSRLADSDGISWLLYVDDNGTEKRRIFTLT